LLGGWVVHDRDYDVVLIGLDGFPIARTDTRQKVKKSFVFGLCQTQLNKADDGTGFDLGV